MGRWRGWRLPQKTWSGLSSLGLQIARKLKELGFVYAALDLEGYRSGSLNASLGMNG